MIQCQAYHMELSTDRTCVCNQQKLVEFRKRNRRKLGGTAEILTLGMPSEYYKIHMCDGCKTGERLYAKAKKDGRLPKWKRKFLPGNKLRMDMVAYHAQNARVGW